MQWQFCEECGRCYLEMYKSGKCCSDGCIRKRYNRYSREWYKKKKKNSADLKEIAHEIIRIRQRVLSADSIEELRVLADRLIDFCDEWEGIKFD